MKENQKQEYKNAIARLKNNHPQVIEAALAETRAIADGLVASLKRKGVSICPCIKGDILRDLTGKEEVLAAIKAVSLLTAVEVRKETKVSGYFIGALDHLLTRLDEIEADDVLAASDI